MLLAESPILNRFFRRIPKLLKQYNVMFSYYDHNSYFTISLTPHLLYQVQELQLALVLILDNDDALLFSEDKTVDGSITLSYTS
jgi:hypothetical protein